MVTYEPPATKAAVPHTHEDRPSSKSILPFRVVVDSPILSVEHEALLPDGQRAPIVTTVGVPDGKNDRLYNSLGQSIYKLMRMFWDLESTVDETAKQRDDAVTRCVAAEAEAKELREKMARITRGDGVDKGGYNGVGQRGPDKQQRQK